MNCFEVRNELSELDWVDYSDLKTLPENICTHIENCNDCRTYLAELSDMKALINAAIPIPCKNGVTLHEHLASRIALGDTKPALLKPKHRFFPVATLAAVAAVVAVVFVGGFPIGDLADKFAGVQKNNSAEILLADESFDYATEQSDDGNNAQSNVARTAESEPETYAVYDSLKGNVEYKTKTTDDYSDEVVWETAGETAISFNLKTRTTTLTNGEVVSDALESSGETTAAYDPSKNAEFDALPEEGAPMMMAMLPDSEEAKTEESVIAEAEAQEEEATLCKSIDSVLEAARLYFEQNGCVHEDGRHEISHEMAETVGETEFVKWYNEIAVHDLPTLYTIENFKKHFGIE